MAQNNVSIPRSKLLEWIDKGMEASSPASLPPETVNRALDLAERGLDMLGNHPTVEFVKALTELVRKATYAVPSQEQAEFEHKVRMLELKNREKDALEGKNRY